MILAACDRFGALPSQVRAESTALFRLMATERDVAAARSRADRREVG